MPFTVTHVAAAVPVAFLCGWRVPFSALAIGAMLPDISVFYPVLFDYSTTHSMSGILTHCLPLGVLGYYVYHAILKRPLVDLLPSSASERLRPWTEKPIDFSLPQVFAVLGCVGFGAFSHVVWDAFTHRGRWGVEMIPALGESATEQLGIDIPWYALIQHGSSIILLPPLLMGFALWVWRQPRPQSTIERAQMPRTVSWAVMAFMSLAVLMYAQTMRTTYPQLNWVRVCGIAVKHGGGVALTITMLYCSGMHWLWWRQRHAQTFLPDVASQ